MNKMLLAFGLALALALPAHAANRRARDYCRYIVFRKKRGTRRRGISPLNADDISV